MCVRFRNGAFDAIKSAAALSLIPLPLRAALRWKGLHFRNQPTAEFAKRWLFFKFQRFCRSWCTPRVLLPAMLTHHRQGAVGKSPAEAVLAAMKLSQKGGAWLSGGAVQSEHHRYPKGTYYGRTPSDEPKSRKMHQCELVGPAHVSPPFPVLKPVSKGRLWSPLACLSPLSFFTRRKMEPPEGVGLVEQSVNTYPLKKHSPQSSLQSSSHPLPRT